MRRTVIFGNDIMRRDLQRTGGSNGRRLPRKRIDSAPRGVDRDPAVAIEIDLRPGMRLIARHDGVLPGRRRTDAPRYIARRDTKRAIHQSRSRGVMRARPLPITIEECDHDVLLLVHRSVIKYIVRRRGTNHRLYFPNQILIRGRDTVFLRILQQELFR